MRQVRRGESAEACPIFLVGTRFQAVMANAIRRELGLSEYDLVCYFRGSLAATERDRAFASLAGAARNITNIDRRSSTISQMFALYSAVGRLPRSVFLAQISNEFILSIFRLRPRLRMCTFDEGGFNISIEGPFFSPERRSLRRPRDVLSFLLFPMGPLHYAKAWSDRHYTSFPVGLNFMREKATPVRIDWSEYLEPTESSLAVGARRIMVLPCFADFQGGREERSRIARMAATCDVVARHPRDVELLDIPSVHLSSPIEALVESAIASGSVEVFHYASTVGLTLTGWRCVSVVDISKTPSTDPVDPPAGKDIAK